MITCIYEGSRHTYVTNGYEEELDLVTDREEILTELKENIILIKDMCEKLNIDYLEFVCQPLD